jgi:nitroreductase/FMN reductase [NAD(P)H]
MSNESERLKHLLELRFGDFGGDPGTLGPLPPLWLALAGRGSCRRFKPEPVAAELIETLCALALAAPSKSDLQQRNIILIDDAALHARIAALLTAGPLAQDWIGGAPHLLVFCGNNRRQRLLHQMRGHPFANDHLDAFFNAACDAAIAMAAFMLAAEARGLGCTPVSAIRNHAEAVSEMLCLPDHVFPFAGLALGWPGAQPPVSPRLPLAVTVHRNRYDDTGAEAAIEAYDRRRAAIQPFGKQRAPERFGAADFYGWSEDKARQYASPERADWGDYIRKRGFRLD